MAPTLENQTAQAKQTKLTIGICGGGIAGLTLAIALQKFSHGEICVNLYESTKKFTEIGTGIGLTKRPWQVLKRLGLAESLAKRTSVPQDENELAHVSDLRKSDQEEGFVYHGLYVPLGIIPFHRADFQQVLSAHCDPDIVNFCFSKRLAYYTQPGDAEMPGGHAEMGAIKLHFDDGSSASCDVLIGADGIKSATRRSLLTEAAGNIAATDPDGAHKLLSGIDPVWSGSVAYRAVVPAERLEKINPKHRGLHGINMYTGLNKHTVIYPISHGQTKLLNIAGVCDSPGMENTKPQDDMVARPCEKEEILAQFAGWESEVQQVLDCVDKGTKWPINVVTPLSTITHGRVALIGDAAHAMLPYQASGAGQGIEDAYVLAGLLCHPQTTVETLPAALKTYEDVRLGHATNVQRWSRMSGQSIHFVPEEVEQVLSEWYPGSAADEPIDLTNKDDLKRVGIAMEEGWKWAWTTDAQDDFDRAMAKLGEQFE